MNCIDFTNYLSSGVTENKTFLVTWKDIHGHNEIQYTIENEECTSDGISIKMGQSNASSLKGCVR